MKASIFAFCLCVSAGAAIASPTISVDTPVGAVLAAETDGMTLYTYRNDQYGRSNCSGVCAASWPPYLVTSGAVAGDASTIIVREDGSPQWATPEGMPLYFWSGDMVSGQVGGDGAGGVWNAVRQ